MLNDDEQHLLNINLQLLDLIDLLIGRKTIKKFDLFNQVPSQLKDFEEKSINGAFCIVGAGAHGSIFMVRDYDATLNYNYLLDRVIRHREQLFLI